MQPSTDTNMTSDQWSYIHRNIIFLVLSLILKHVLFRLMQKYLIPVINCLLCCMNWYSWGVIGSSQSYRNRIVVKGRESLFTKQKSSSISFIYSSWPEL